MERTVYAETLIRGQAGEDLHVNEEGGGLP